MRTMLDKVKSFLRGEISRDDLTAEADAETTANECALTEAQAAQTARDENDAHAVATHSARFSSLIPYKIERVNPC